MKNANDLSAKIAELNAIIESLKAENAKLVEATQKSKKPGVISHIISCLLNAGKAGISKSEILASLQSEFPDRDSFSMTSTLNVQLPGRISKERFEIETFEQDGQKLYRKAN